MYSLAFGSMYHPFLAVRNYFANIYGEWNSLVLELLISRSLLCCATARKQIMSLLTVEVFSSNAFIC
jgi:hypothetical protein